MKKFPFLILILILSTPCFAQVEVYFEHNSYSLTKQVKEILSDLVENRNLGGGGILHLAGHADTTGTQTYNLSLSKRRVEQVKSFLIKKGVSVQEISTDYTGESLATKLHQKYNRKVEITIRPSKVAAEQLYILQNSFRPKTQTFTYTADSIVALRGEKGTKITIQPNSLLLPNGELATGKIDYELNEYYDMPAFFSEQLHTVSNGVPIESSGMIRIRAFSNGEPLSVKKGELIEIEMSDNRWGKDGFETFYGKRLPNGNMDWITDSTNNNMEDSAELLTLEMGVRGKIVIDKNGTLKRFPNSIGSENDTTLTEILSSETEIRNVIRSNKMGFINCDRYIRDRYTSQIGFAIRIENPDISPLHCLLVLDEMNSLLPINYDFQKKYFSQSYNLSRKKPLKLLVLGYNIKTKQKCMYVETIKPSPEILRTIKMSAVSTEEIKEAF